jgi:hypothetical protein
MDCQLSHSLGGVCNDVDAAVVLSLAMLRLFPVRTYDEMVIRWDDEITPERLVACGWKGVKSNRR